MPFNGTPLSNQELWCLKEWIKPGSGGTFPDPPQTLPLVMPTTTPPPPPADAGVQANCATADEIRNKILLPKCLPCHGKAMSALGLDLETPGAKGRLLGVASKEGGACGGTPIAKPDGTGVLFDKVVGPVPINCGQQMPYGVAPLNAAEVACLKAWIQM
jgi:hypothetical protein